MFSRSFLEKLKRQKFLILVIVQVHILVLLLVGILLFMGSLKRGKSLSFFNFFDSPPTAPSLNVSPTERKARVILSPKEKPPAGSNRKETQDH